MTKEEALEIVSYKLALKDSEGSLQDPVLNTDIVKQAIKDKEAGSEREIDTREYLAASKLMKEIRHEHGRESGEKWLAENSRKEGVTTTDSGLQYRILQEGSGAKCVADSQVEVHYRGQLTDGSTFDSSYDRGAPSSFPVKKVIKGWQEGLCLMSEGAKYEFYIPQELGYGDRGSGSKIPPYSVLIFEVEFIKVI